MFPGLEASYLAPRDTADEATLPVTCDECGFDGDAPGILAPTIGDEADFTTDCPDCGAPILRIVYVGEDDDYDRD